VTDAERPQFDTDLLRMARVFGQSPTGEVLGDYFDDLKDYPLATVQNAISHCRKTSKFWPRPAVLREACTMIPGVSVSTIVPAWVNHNADVYFCKDCDDTGFVLRLECPGDGRCGIGNCGKLGSNGHAHDYVRRCHCRSSNPVLLRDREESRKVRPPQELA
jgi:hypothetical protein